MQEFCGEKPPNIRLVFVDLSPREPLRSGAQTRSGYRNVVTRALKEA